MVTLEERVKQLEGQLNRLTQDRRIGDSLLGPFPVSDSHMGLRYEGRYYLGGTTGVVDSLATLTMTANRIYAVPFLVVDPMHYEELGIKMETAQAGGARLGVYDSTRGLVPSRLLFDADAASTSSGDYKSKTFDKKTLLRGLKWLVVLTGSTPVFYKVPHAEGWEILGRGTNIQSGFGLGWYGAATYGALPSVFPTPTITSDIPLIWIKVVA